MNAMSQVTKALLNDLLSIESESYYCEEMAQAVETICEALGARTERAEAGNLYARKGDGDFPPCYVAHLDTVHRITGDGITPVWVGDNVTGINPVTMAQTGVGGDDKCGIWAALYCLENLPSCRVAFFQDEEVGCEGSYQADPDRFADVAFIIQADRRGDSDFVTDIAGLSLSSKAFQKAAKPAMKRHKFAFSPGGMTDVQALSENGVGISVANLSAGYHNPHQDDEYIHWPSLKNTASLMLEMGQTMSGVRWTHKAKRRKPRWQPRAWSDDQLTDEERDWWMK